MLYYCRGGEFLSQKQYVKPQEDNLDSRYYDYSIFRDVNNNNKSKPTQIKKRKTNNIPSREKHNVEYYIIGKRDKHYRINAQRKKIIVRRRRIIFAAFVLCVALVIFGLFTLLFNLIFKHNNSPLSNEELLEQEIINLDLFLENNSIFYCESDNETIKSLEKMLHTYTLVDDGNNAVTKTKNNASYFAWDASKYVWLDNKEYMAELKKNIREVGMLKNGYIWSSEESAKLPETGSMMFDTNVKFISAVCDVCLWETSNEFLYSMDTTKVNSEDTSEGLTVLQKLEKAIEYVLDYQYSKNNKIIRSVDSRSLGTRYGSSGNYWYNYRFGYSDAYNNIYFYNALNKLVLLYSTDYCYDIKKASEYSQLSKDVYEGFEVFWDNTKQRYVGAIDVNDQKHDYGFVFLNIEAVYYGLADKTKADAIYSWINGERIIESDTSTGKDIYYHGFSPRINTLKADTFWWNSIDNSLRFDGNADYGMYWQNGGGSLLLSYYDIMSRFKIYGLENAMPIMKMMLTEYDKDGILRNNTDDGSLCSVATNGDFPESGLVPSVFVYGIMGVSTDGNSLCVNPSLPVGSGAVGIKGLSFGSNAYNILSNNVSTYIFADYYSSVKLKVGGFPKNTEVLCIAYKDKKPIFEKTLVSDSEGFVNTLQSLGDNVFIKFTLNNK